MKKKETLQNKIYRKFHAFLFQVIQPGEWINNFYPAFCHGKRYAKKNGKSVKELVDITDKPSDIYLLEEPNIGAGIGHQLGNYIAGYHYSKVFKVRHAYSPFTDSEWDDFFGFGEGQDHVDDLLKQGYKIHMIPFIDEENNYAVIKNIIDSYEGKKVILKTELDQFYQKQYDAAPHIKEKFEKAKSRAGEKLIYNSDEISVAVHIRRGDINVGQVTGEATLTKRWLDLNYYEKALSYMQENIKLDKPVHIYIFSQDNDDYSRFEKFGKVTVCIDMPARDSFLHMVRADILVMGKSSFSYKPALLSDGIRICPSGFWHEYPQNEKWIVIDSN